MFPYRFPNSLERALERIGQVSLYHHTRQRYRTLSINPHVPVVHSINIPPHLKYDVLSCFIVCKLFITLYLKMSILHFNEY